jgi:hypothetical protein
LCVKLCLRRILLSLFNLLLDSEFLFSIHLLQNGLDKCKESTLVCVSKACKDEETLCMTRICPEEEIVIGGPHPSVPGSQGTGPYCKRGVCHCNRRKPQGCPDPLKEGYREPSRTESHEIACTKSCAAFKEIAMIFTFSESGKNKKPMYCVCFDK